MPLFVQVIGWYLLFVIGLFSIAGLIAVVQWILKKAGE